MEDKNDPYLASVNSVRRSNYDNRDFKRAAVEEFAAQEFMRVGRYPPGIRRAVQEHAAASGRDRIWLEDVREAIEGLPLYPAADVQPNLRDNAGLSQIFPVRKFNSLPFVKQYLQLWQDKAAERQGLPLVWIFRWPHIAEAICLHTLDVDDDEDGVDSSVRITFTAKPKKGPRFKMTLEPLSQLKYSPRYDNE